MNTLPTCIEWIEPRCLNGALINSIDPATLEVIVLLSVATLPILIGHLAGYYIARHFAVE